MAEYTTEAQFVAAETAIYVKVLEDGKPVAYWRVDVNPNWNASAVLSEAEHRIQQYINARADLIEQQTAAELAQMLVDALDKRVWL